MNAADQTVSRAARLWKPPEELSLSQWSDRYRRTSREASAEVGQWTTRPYQREPFDAFTDPRVRRLVVMSSVQMLKTELQLCVIGYCIHNRPAPILLVLPRDGDCDTFSKLRLAPMLRDTPALQNRVADAKSRFSGNTISQKMFPGGHLRIVAGGSPANLAALPIKILLCDEIDKFPPSAGAEGDPIALAEGRTAEFPDSKVVLTCSPTIAGYSAIERAYNESDRREYEVPCPHCQQPQVLKWSQVTWDDALPSRKKQADTARYVCEHCQGEWNDPQRWKSINAGSYRATEAFTGIAGFRISQLCSLKKRLSQIVLQFLRAKDDGAEALKVFFNTVLAETWVDRGEAPDHEKLLERREKYQTGIVPPGALFLTAGADVQRDRIEVEIVGWGRGRESWSVDYRVLEGKTSEPAVWAELEKVARETFPLAGGGKCELPIARFFIDSGDGTTTNDVYNWCRQQPASQVCAIKGDGRGDLPVSERRPVDVTIGGKRLRRGLHIRHVNSSFFKFEFYADLRKRRPTDEEIAQGWVYPPGYCHFPHGQNYGDEHFKQIVAEQLIATVNRKTRRTRMEWQQLRPRNEALDCRVYARAAAWDYGMDRFQEKHWQILTDKLARESKASQHPAPSQKAAEVPPAPAEPPPPKARESWIPRQSGSWFAR
jgi:phage terminase large subunit GpA-like protein